MHRSLVALVLAVAGCGDDSVRILEGACSFGDEHWLAIPDGPIVDDIALASDGEHTFAAWSERAGAFVRGIDGSGAPVERARRIGPSCDGGLAATMHEGTLLVACGRRGREGHDDAGSVQLHAIRGGQRTTRATVGELGSSGEGVAITVDGEGVSWIGWQRAEGAVAESWVTRIAEGAMPERLSAQRFRGSRPALAWDGARVLTAWSEIWSDEAGAPEGRVMLRAGARAARPVAETAFEPALPVLRRGAGEVLLLGFRDRRPARSRPRFQVAPLEREGTTLGRIESAAHANARGASTLLACAGDVFVIAPRTHSRTERLVSVRRYSSELVAQGPEMQIYEHGAAYEHADAVCVDEHVVVLFASRRSQHQPRGSVRAVAMQCGDGD